MLNDAQTLSALKLIDKNTNNLDSLNIVPKSINFGDVIVGEFARKVKVTAQSSYILLKTLNGMNAYWLSSYIKDGLEMHEAKYGDFLVIKCFASKNYPKSYEFKCLPREVILDRLDKQTEILPLDQAA